MTDKDIEQYAHFSAIECCDRTSDYEVYEQGYFNGVKSVEHLLNGFEEAKEIIHKLLVCIKTRNLNNYQVFDEAVAFLGEFTE